MNPIEIMAGEITREQAIELVVREWWVGRPAREVALAQLRQERLCMPFGDFHEAVEQAVGGPVGTHEFANRTDLLARIEAGHMGACDPFASLANVKLRRSRSGLYTVRGTGRRYRSKVLALCSCVIGVRL